jgi:hypothetical protein
MNISRGAYNILFFSACTLKVKIFLKIFCRENCVNIWLLYFGSNEFVVNNVEGEII